MNNNSKTTILCITLVFIVLIAAVGWVLTATNVNAKQYNEQTIKRLDKTDEIILDLIENRGSTTTELKNINDKLEDISTMLRRHLDKEHE